MFGGDAVKRKFGTKPPDEWESALSYLTDAQLRHGLESIIKSGAEHIPSLPQFLVFCRSSREFKDDSTQKISGPITDNWGTSANFYLLAHVRNCAHVKNHFNGDETRILVQFKNAWAEDMRVDDKGEGEGVPREQQMAAWFDCMKRATAAISGLRAQQSEAA